jgi:hypothetical protein
MWALQIYADSNFGGRGRLLRLTERPSGPWLLLAELFRASIFGYFMSL